ncbi:MAG: S-methyl-5'-thioadenosine phosphorylase, partial [Bacteroidales bacterium]|nr:S-methyl-5'-thioadenosine phosphorylase [Bacteroidales bacterium]
MKYQKIAIIGGSGLEKLDLFEHAKYIKVETVYGSPSSDILHGQIHGKDVYIVSRHGHQHTVTPTHVNNQAHIKAIEQLGCEAIIATTACGSLREEIEPGHLAFPNQVIDFTRFRKNTFFDEFKPGEFKHVPFADPFDEAIIAELKELSNDLKLKHHDDKTVVTIEGPRFSSRA